VAAAFWPKKAIYGHRGRIRPRMATLVRVRWFWEPRPKHRLRLAEPGLSRLSVPDGKCKPRDMLVLGVLWVVVLSVGLPLATACSSTP
jgi:hypothetical protein